MGTIRLDEIEQKSNAALEATEGDPGASPVLAAVVRELSAKAAKAVGLAAADRGWEAVLEVEQAADSARVAAAADTGASEATRTSIEDAHLAICMLKASLAGTASST